MTTRSATQGSDQAWLNLPLDKVDKNQLKTAVMIYTATNNINIFKLKTDVSILTAILPYINEHPGKFHNLQASHLNTGFKAINDMYHCIRNRILNKERLAADIHEFNQDDPDSIHTTRDTSKVSETPTPQPPQIETDNDSAKTPAPQPAPE